MTDTTTRRTRKATQSAAPAATPAPVQATPAAPTAPDTTAPANEVTYTIPAITFDTIGDEATRATYVAAVGDAYRNADKSTKAAMRSVWAKFQSDALNGIGTDPDAVAKLTLVRDVNTVLVTTRATVEADPADAYVIHLAALSVAMGNVAAAFREAHGTDAYQAMMDRVPVGADRGNLTDDEVTARDALATKLAVVKSGTRRSGPVRSVEAHIRSALDAAPKGTILTCAQVHNHRSDAYGPDDAPSVGAVGAAHGRDMDGIVSTENDAKVKGFRLA